MKARSVLKHIIAFFIGIAALLAPAHAGSERSLVIWALEQDALSWSFNRLDYGSYGTEVEQGGYPSDQHVYRMSYTYNNGAQGWTEVYIKGGSVQGIRFHDNDIWRDVRTDQSRSQAKANEAARIAATPPRDLIVWALEQDAGSWGFNRLDLGSYGTEVEQSGYDSSVRVYRMSYTYNGGRPGWIEANIQNGSVIGIRYHDNQNWTYVRTQQERNANASREKDNCKAYARARGDDPITQCGW